VSRGLLLKDILQEHNTRSLLRFIINLPSIQDDNAVKLKEEYPPQRLYSFDLRHWLECAIVMRDCCIIEPQANNQILTTKNKVLDMGIPL